MVIIEPPPHPDDVEGWRDAIARLQANRERMEAREYQMVLASLERGLEAALAEPPPPSTDAPLSIRARLRKQASQTQSESDPSALWLRIARENGFEDFLSAQDGFGRSSSGGRRWRHRRMPGIYFWLAENGEAYVGQSVRPQARLRQHLRDHGDIVHAAFQQCSRQDLNALEQKLIEAAGRHFPLRNIKFAVSTASPVAFDELVSSAEQAAFVAGEDLESGDWASLEEHSRLQFRKFERFVADPDSGTALHALRLFVFRAIPKPAATEARFWSVSVFPDRCFVRLNAGHQEVFTCDGRTGRVRVFSDQSLGWLRSWRMPYQVPSWVNRVQPAHLDRWLEGHRLLSCRRLVLRLMRHTQALNSASHCPQLMRHPI